MTDSKGATTTQPTRVLYVHNSADLYGASRSLLRLVTNIRRREFDPVVVLPRRGILQERIEQAGVRVIIDESLAIITRYEPLWKVALRFPVSVWRLCRLIRNLGTQIVHTNIAVAFSPSVAAKLAGVPHVWHVREAFEEFGGLWKLYRLFMLGFSSRIIAVSHATAAQFPRSAKVRVIHNGFPLSEFDVDQDLIGQSFRAQYGLGRDLVVGCVGRIKWVRKGQEYLVQAAAHLKQRDICARFVIVGAPFGPNQGHLDRLKALARELGVEDAFVFTGELTDTKPAYAAMNIFVLPSAQPEPFGGVVMEAMAMGLPVIATNIGGSTDQVEEGVSGFLVPPGDSEKLADKIANLLADEPLRRSMGQAGRRRMERLFTFELMVEKVTQLYREILN